MPDLTPGHPGNHALRRALIVALITAFLAAGCGGSQPLPAANTGNSAESECDADGSTSQGEDDCGEVLIGLTDAEGDFVTYSVDVTSLELVRADGTVVQTLPTSARIDFAEYTELTEFLTAASVPPGRYVSGAITVDYSEAEIYVEAGGGYVEAIVVDRNGEPVGSAELEILLDNRRQLVVRAGIPSLLTVDFDLDASHQVDLSTMPATATAEPFLLAEIDAVDSKELRLRGPLLSVDLENSSYTIAVRPFHLRQGDFGRARVHTDDATTFEVNGAAFKGQRGLQAMSALESRTPTVAFGELDVLTRRFLAAEVYAGSSVPGYGFDVMRGNVIARDGNSLTVQGAIIIPRQGRARFHRKVTVEMGDGTLILKGGQHEPALDLSAVSVGQRINAFGSISADPDTGVVLDATEGRVRMLMTRLSGTVNTVNEGRLEMSLQSIDRRPVRLFEFAGTGMSPDTDANPASYEVATGSIMVATSEDAPVRVFGFVEAFGEAPPDFEARTVVDYSDARALLAIGWGQEGTGAPFLALGEDGLVLDLENPDIGKRHYIRQGGVFIDLLSLDASPLIAPHPERPGVFAIKQGRRIWIHSDFGLFVADVARRLDGNTSARGLYAKGGYQADAGQFMTTRVGILLD